MRYLAILVGAIVASAQPSSLSTRFVPADFPSIELDLSGVRAFWRVHDLLRDDREPTAAEWDQLFATPGYALLEAREQRRSGLIRAFRLAYMPSAATEREAALAEGGWHAFVLPHLQRIPVERRALAAFASELSELAVLPEALRLAGDWLPDGTIERVAPPPISFLFFGDARGYPERLLFDLLYFLEVGDSAELLGHELHHYYRSRIAQQHRPYGEDWLAWTLATTEEEGIAGLIDKREVPELSPEQLARRYTNARRHRYYVEYQDHYRRSGEWLAWADSLLARIAGEPDSAAAIALRFHREIPDNGRIMGAYMAEVIIRELGREALLGVVGRPFRFWARYNDAARLSGDAYVLSDAAMMVIAERGRRYADDPTGPARQPSALP